MGLPRSASNKISWVISVQPTIKRRVTSICDKFIFKTVQLNKTIISNRIKFISNMLKTREILISNYIPFLIRKWDMIEHLLKDLYKEIFTLTMSSS